MTRLMDLKGAPPRKIDPAAAREQMNDQSAFLLDVRAPDEFAAGHAAGATCIPLTDLERRVGELPAGRPVVVMCHSGHRSALAVERLHALGVQNVADIAGGIVAWKREGLPLVSVSNVISLERQVRIAAGLLVLSFTVAGFLVNRYFFFGATLIGFMLALTGTIGICPMMSVLRLLPWNRRVTS